MFKGEEKDLTIVLFFSVVTSCLVLIWPLITRKITNELINLPIDEAIPGIIGCGLILITMIVIEMFTEKNQNTEGLCNDR